MMTTARTTTALVSIVLNTGITPEHLAEEAGVPLSWLREPTVIPYREGMKIWEAAEVLSGDPFVGLSTGAQFGVDQLGALSASFVLAPTLRVALKGLPQLISFVIQGVPITLDEDAEGATFRYRSPGLIRHGVDSMFAALVAIARQSTRTAGLRPGHVRFQSPRPSDSIAPYVDFFGVEPTWHQTVSELRFMNEDLERPMRGADSRAAALLQQVASEKFGATTSSEHRTLRKIDAALAVILPRGDVSLVAMAAELQVSVRTLQRRLKEAGTTFAARRDRVLCEEADRLLTRRDLSLEEIATKLGFSGRPAFSRAYQRWTGRAPSAARKETR